VRKSSPKKRILKNSEVDELKLGSFCLLDIDSAADLEVAEAKPSEELAEVRGSSVCDEGALEEELKRAYEEGFASGKKEGFEEGRKKGFKAGYEEGYREGHQKGIEDGKREGFLEGKKEGRETVLKRYGELISKFNRLLSELNEVKTSWKKELYSSEDRIVNLVLIALSKLVMAVPEREKVKAVVEACLDKVADMENVKLRLNPKDWELIKEDVQLPSAVRLELDESLNRGDCVVETESGSVETRVEERVRDIISLLTEKHV